MIKMNSCNECDHHKIRTCIRIFVGDAEREVHYCDIPTLVSMSVFQGREELILSHEVILNPEERLPECPLLQGSE